MSPEVRDFVWRAIRLGPRPRRVVELGSREVAGGTVRALFPDVASYTGVDLVDGPAVDVVADALLAWLVGLELEAFEEHPERGDLYAAGRT